MYETTEDKVWMVQWDERRKRMVVNRLSEMMGTNITAYLNRDIRRPSWYPVAYAPTKQEAEKLAREILHVRFHERPQPTQDKCRRCREEDEIRPRQIHRC